MSNLKDEHFSSLIAGLEEANTEPGRLGSMFALAHVLTYLSRKEVPAETLSPLYALMTALLDLAMGKNPPLLGRSKGKPSDPRGQFMDELGKTWAAAALELLIWAKVQKKIAAKRVLRKIEHWDVADHKTSWKTVCSWRDRIKKGKMDDPETRTFFTWVHTTQSAAQGNPLDAANYFLKNAPSLQPKK